MGILLFPLKHFCLTIELPGRRIGQRRDATRAPNQVRNGWRLPSRLLFSPPLHLSNSQKLSRLWGPLHTTIDPESPTYKGNGPVATFYAESWALAHMLFLAPDYTDNFSKFISALQRGRNFAESCEAAFAKTPAQVYADLRQYFDRKIMYGKVFQAPLGKKAALPEIAKVEPFDARLMLADLDLALGRHMQARNEFDRAIVWDRCRHCACGRVHRRSPDCEAGLQ
jgi:hypothetical protein